MLIDKHEPELVFGAPTCGPWSKSSTTMDPEVKALLRVEELEAFQFFRMITEQQARHIVNFSWNSHVVHTWNSHVVHSYCMKTWPWS